ncbi:Pyridinium-3,5-bisthiocarboxylic acid mononucleotide nickel insertion protein [bioreactor metagenome]|uniref:Pyridinium-3,5-bisthiocarboxylic acid mononucleotide nickel insertion protein n=1 Tax=bioreactor metagenome TaxID=1076179 RepID=A0A645FTP8_9ZZZZ
MLEGSNIPVIYEDVDTELVTPTGCGIIKSLANEIGRIKEELTVEQVGYGMGKRQTSLFGAVRIIIGKSL